MPALQVSATPLQQASPRHEATYLNVTADYSYTIDQAYYPMCLCHSSFIYVLSTHPSIRFGALTSYLPTAVSSGVNVYSV